MADTKNKQATIVRDFTDTNFNDTGVERQFTADETLLLPEGVFLNYEAAGIARAPTADDRAGKPTPDSKAATAAS